jgi:hypothetical protein
MSYLLWVTDDRKTLVRWWPDNTMEVCTRDDPGAIWSPPTELKPERVT